MNRRWGSSTKKAVDHIEDLASVEGVDVIFMEATDLSQNLDIPGQVRDREILKGIDSVIKACEAKGVAF
jgi:2-keto-3-deoxy-L-rhamnonate aldolase RhmA